MLLTNAVSKLINKIEHELLEQNLQRLPGKSKTYPFFVFQQTRLEGISSNLSHDPVPVPLLTLVQQRASGFLPVAMKTYERLRCCCLWQELEVMLTLWGTSR